MGFQRDNISTKIYCMGYGYACVVEIKIQLLKKCSDVKQSWRITMTKSQVVMKQKGHQ